MRLVLISALVVALSSCATAPELTAPITDESHEKWSQRQQQLSTQKHWQIHGRVALFANDDVYNLGLHWVMNESRSKLNLEAALGQGMIELEKTNTHVSLLTSDGKSYLGQNAEQVLYQATGWSIPVEGLAAWIKGINHADSDYLPDIDAAGRVSSLQQDNWTINYLEYSQVKSVDQRITDLPRKIYMKRQNLALKIVIDQWQPQQNTQASEIFPSFRD